MDHTAVRTLTELTFDDLQRLIRGYAAEARYRVRVLAEGPNLTITVRREPRQTPYIKQFDPQEGVSYEMYAALVGNGFCLGAYLGDRLVGIALAEARQWNQSLWVWEFHVEPEFQGRGIGRDLMEALVERARRAGLRTIVCETQNTNAPAVDFYRTMGFKIEGIDLSYYSNADYPDGEIALFMKKRL